MYLFRLPVILPVILNDNKGHTQRLLMLPFGWFAIEQVNYGPLGWVLFILAYNRLIKYLHLGEDIAVPECLYFDQ